MKRSRYRQLYAVETTEDPRTGKARQRAVYTGDYYGFAQAGAAGKHSGARHIPCVLAYIGVFLAYGFTDLPSTRYFLSLPFYLGMGLPLAFWALAVWRTARLPARFTEVQRDQSLWALQRAAFPLAILCALFTVGTLVLVFSGGAGDHWPAECLFVAAMAAVGGGAYYSGAMARAADAQVQKRP